MDNSVQNITKTVSLIASKKTWIEDLAIQQLIKTSKLNGMYSVTGMPDLHPGRGYPIGAAFFTKGRIYPALVGNDIGCGMGFWKTELTVSKLNIDKLVKKIGDVESPLNKSWLEAIEKGKVRKQITVDHFDRALGTIGGGNHFCEFQAFDEVYEQESFSMLNLDKNQLMLLVHSGSRGLGQSVLEQHISNYNHDGIHEVDVGFVEYLKQHDEAVRWAELNRELIAKRFIKAVKTTGERVLDINHNLVTPKSIQGVEGWLHRKGATPSDAGYVVIPGSRGDYSYLVRPLAKDISLYSLAHGAGRKWKRGECKGRLDKKFKREDLYRTSLGSRVICGNKELLYDEAPQAYKKCETIISDLEDAGLITVIARLKPVLTFKTHGDCSA